MKDGLSPLGLSKPVITTFFAFVLLFPPSGTSAQVPFEVIQTLRVTAPRYPYSLMKSVDGTFNQARVVNVTVF